MMPISLSYPFTVPPWARHRDSRGYFVSNAYGLQRHLREKGNDTLVNIGFGKLGSINIDSVTDDVLAQLHRDLITWNPRARIIELDHYTSYEYWDEYDNNGEWLSSEWCYTKAAKEQFAITIERLNQECFNLLSSAW